ncbi:tetratricopeptide repeat-containing glycosyltransferase family 2 protein [Desulfotomaculum copahuensis]|uniref:Glycosyltransferase 2-like domain-containing protein n=1 Tax=Desulfotomaculum copahuensis TaxID=1838280 RepID=A0A1B7LD40_9FIRM|nr:glycosyltransferase [Desulfotomaculum copahuensis]OAT80851.1 hypothetical protein A6M21_12330 [Desulfotomaculum copahuensis]
MSGRPSVSMCLIVRNEEDCLASCLDSARHLVREIIVVDTGSTDRTCEVAAACGATVFHFAWNDDFAAARNYSLNQAGGEWILVLDADEMLAPVTAEEFARLLSNTETEGYFVHIQNHLGNGAGSAHDQVVRLFKNRPGYRFAGAIHEQVAGAIKRANRGGGLASSPLVIHHYGYLDERVAARQKHDRNIRVIKKALAQKPADPFLFYSLGIEYFNCGRHSHAVQCLERALALMDGGEGYLRDLLLLLCLGLFKTGQREKLNRTVERATALLPADADLQLLQGLSFLSANRYGPAITELRSALHRSALLAPHHIHSLLGDALSLSDRPAEAAKDYFQALRLAPRMLYPLTRILDFTQKAGLRPDWAGLAQFAPLTEKKFLYNQLLAKGENNLALILLLLIILDTCGRGENPAADCREFVRLVAEHPPGGQGRAVRYLYLAAREMLVYTGALAYGLAGAWLRPLPALSSLAASCLALITAEFAWPPVNLKW